MVEYIKEQDSLNTGRKTINEELTRSNNNADKAKIDSAEALLKAIASMNLSESIRNELNQIVIEGDSSVEAAQARVDENGQTHPTLKQRIDDGFEKTTSQLNDIVTLSPRSQDNQDMTDVLQTILSNMPNGSTVRIPKGLYLVSKNENLEGFPNSDQPCLLIKNKRNIRIIADGVTLKTNTHAQGILEIQGSENIVIEGMKTEGLAEFPNLDGQTGRGEKGTSDAGYHTTGFWGYYKNNSLDTSGNINGGNVPKPWGMFKNGFIGNAGFGVLLLGCKNISFYQCESTGFNFAGFGVGFWGDSVYPPSENILFDNCYAHTNYQANFYATNVNSYKLLNTLSEKAGHPEAKPLSDTFQDPGYGFMATGTADMIGNDINVKNSIFRDCVRKGIDSHAGKVIKVSGNIVENCYACGIFASWSSPTQPSTDIIISENIIEKSGLSSHGAIYVSGVRGDEYSRQNVYLNCKINKNTIRDWGYRAITARTFDKLWVTDNTVEGLDDRELNDSLIAILLGDNEKRSYELDVTRNNITDDTGNVVVGIQVTNSEGRGIGENNISLSTDKQAAGIYAQSPKVDLDIINNLVKINKGRGYSLSSVSGTVFNNKTIGGDLLDIYPNHGNLGRTISLSLTANNGDGIAAIATGDDLVIEIKSVEQGLQITLKNIPTNVIPTVLFSEGGSVPLQATGNSFVNYIYLRESSYAKIVLGIKLSKSSNTHTPFNNLMSGIIKVDISL